MRVCVCMCWLLCVFVMITVGVAVSVLASSALNIGVNGNNECAQNETHRVGLMYSERWLTEPKTWLEIYTRSKKIAK